MSSSVTSFVPQKLRIAQVSPLFESVPPKLYGGTERIVSCLTEALVRAGHDVTLFASDDSFTSARHERAGHSALRLNSIKEPLVPHLVMFERVRKLRNEFDIVHFHTEYMQFGLAAHLGVPCVSTLHGRLDLPEYQHLFSAFNKLNLVSISMHQRRPIPTANFAANVPHGIDIERLKFTPGPGAYLAFLGRIAPEKGVEHAVEIARRTGMHLRIAAKIEPLENVYYQRVKPLFDEPFVEFIGEISDREKSEFLGEAAALVFPITWPEPFGLVMIEALACGTPVVAFRNGSVPEVIRHGETGFIVNDVDGACEAVRSIHKISRETCRKDALQRFSSGRMAEDYVGVYRRILNRERIEINEFDSSYGLISETTTSPHPILGVVRAADPAETSGGPQ